MNAMFTLPLLEIAQEEEEAQNQLKNSFTVFMNCKVIRLGLLLWQAIYAAKLNIMVK